MVFSTDGPIGYNDDWGGASDLVEAADTVRAFLIPDDSQDAAMRVTLDPGCYTAHVGGGTGVVLFELYVVPRP